MNKPEENLNVDTTTNVEKSTRSSYPFSDAHYVMQAQKARKDRTQKRVRANIAKKSRQLNRKLQRSR